MDRPKLLVVDDNQALANMLASALEAEFEPLAVYSVAQARAALDQHFFDAVLTDFELPDGTGADVLAAATARNAAAYRCIVSGRSAAEVADRIPTALADAIWRKPIFPHHFIAAFAARRAPASR